MKRKITLFIFIILLLLEIAWFIFRLKSTLTNGMKQAWQLGYYCPSWDNHTGFTLLYCYQIGRSKILLLAVSQKPILLLEFILLTLATIGVFIFIKENKKKYT